MKKKIFVIIALLVVVGIVVGVLVSRGHKKEETSDIHIQSEKDRDVTEDANDEEERTYNGEGLKVIEEEDVKEENHADASGSWEDTSENTSEDISGNTSEEDVQENEADKDETMSEEDAPVDEKTWGRPY